MPSPSPTPIDVAAFRAAVLDLGAQGLDLVRLVVFALLLGLGLLVALAVARTLVQAGSR